MNLWAYIVIQIGKTHLRDVKLESTTSRAPSSYKLVYIPH